MCTVSAQPRSAASVTAVSGRGRGEVAAQRRGTPTPGRRAWPGSRPPCRSRTLVGTAKPSSCAQRRSPGRRVLDDAHGPVTLHIGVSAHRAQPGAGAAEHATQQLDVDDLADRRDRVALLGQAHRPAHDRGRRVGEQPGRRARSRPGPARSRLAPWTSPGRPGSPRTRRSPPCRRRRRTCRPRPTRPAATPIAWNSARSPPTRICR